MKNYSLKIAILFCAVLVFSKCKPEDEVKSSTCTFSDAESKAYYNTAMKFANSPTRSNCNVLKTASLDLIKKFEKCDAATKAQIAQLTQQWNNIDCNSF
ncbi:hypothetical protein GM921_13695 [Pedobacter sp. LMG 31464]|uniref:Uncharacterized protein n=1 Tax=Pedobacter planticolens TaxID=2679964 RepID=A0A923IVZ2_9SPHI|nr:hypothetical protein [Pedobacter planticolens]MBB2146551.1 hypothetical protein [Pedobacter planticolens]